MAQAVAAAARLPGELVQHLQAPNLVLVTTMDDETGWPTNNLITWTVAMDGSRIRLAADAGGRVMSNIRAHDKVLLTVMVPGACWAVEGTATVLSGTLPGVQLQLGCAEVKVRAVRDVTFFGGRVTEGPRYEVTYDPSLKDSLDRNVLEAMRSL